MIYNPTDTEQKFYYGGIPYVFKPKESRTFEDVLETFALTRGNRNLVKYNPSFDKEMEHTDMDYQTMPWRKLVQLGAARGVFKKPVKREILIKALEDYDNESGRTLPQPSN